MAFVEDFQASTGANIPCETPSSPTYAENYKFYQIHNQPTPLAVCRPQSAIDVAKVVKYATSKNLKIVVRSGGNDIFGRSQVENALTIDMRDIKFVEVDTDKLVARIGGGVLMGGLAEVLDKKGFKTPCVPIAAVGYVGWATLGGYGPFMDHWGLGVDQIVGATIVDWKGDIVKAGPEMLKGIRGGGGNFGVIVELSIKIYPVKKILAGVVLYDSTDISSAFREYVAKYMILRSERLPPALDLQSAFLNSPQGRIFFTIFVWSSDDHIEGRSYLEKVLSFGKVLMNNVVETTAKAWMDTNAPFIPLGVYGGDKAVSIGKLSDSLACTLGENLEKLPSDLATGFSWHDLRGGPSTTPNPDSVFSCRKPHIVIEILATVLDLANMSTSQQWGSEFRASLLKNEDLLDEVYISLCNPTDASVRQMYGANYETLLDLKRKYDPKGVFSLAVPRLDL